MSIYNFSFKFIIVFIVIFAIGLLLRPRHFRNVVLSIYFFCIAYLHFNIHIIETGEYLYLPHFLYTHFPFTLSLGPLAYFFTLSLTENKDTVKKWEWLHFAPALISLISFSFLIAQPAEVKINIVKKFLSGEYAYFRFIIIMILAMFGVYVIMSINKVCENMHKENPLHQKIMIIMITLFSWIFLVFLRVFAILTLSFTIFKISNVLLIINILFVYFAFQKYPGLFLYVTISQSKKQKTKSSLDKVDKDNLERGLEILMKEEKFYCDEDITLKRLSTELAITPHQLSEFLNNYYNKNFNTYINQFRIDEAKEMLMSKENRSTLSIAYAVGFNSYSAFYTVFKNETGFSPADYRKRHYKNFF